jgi:4-amino-4-deoxy-L-arabinose transferase-like glycosyltransferase
MTHDTRRHLWILAGACLLLLVESLTLINTRWVEDDSWYSSKGWTLAQEGRIRMSVFPDDPEYVTNVITTLHADTLGAVFAVFGLGILQARGTSAIFAVGVVVVVFFLASHIGGRLCGVLAAVLVATDSILVVAARTARPEAETVLLCWLALLLLERAIARHSVRLGFASGLACGLGLICHPLALPFLAAMVLFCALQYGTRVWKEPLAWALAAGAVLVLTPYFLWCFSDAAHIASFRAGYLERVAEPFRYRVLGEPRRWSDFIGFSSQRVPLLPHVPLRLQIAVILVPAFVFFARRDRRFGPAALILLLLNLAWLIFLVNKGPRYIVMLSPLFAIVLAWFGARNIGSRYQGVAVAALAVVLITQVGGNCYWLYRYRGANYAAVTGQLREIVPAGSSVYGAITFWMALHDRTYYAYDRTTLQSAVEKLRPQYMILYDRVMNEWIRLRGGQLRRSADAGHGVRAQSRSVGRPGVQQLLRRPGNLPRIVLRTQGRLNRAPSA